MNEHKEEAFFVERFAVDHKRVTLLYTGVDCGADCGTGWFNRHNGSKNERLTLLWEGWMARRDVALEQSQAPAKTWEGCRACYGSGGKKVSPCLVCNGTGRVPKGTQWSQT